MIHVIMMNEISPTTQATKPRLLKKKINNPLTNESIQCLEIIQSIKNNLFYLFNGHTHTHTLKIVNPINYKYIMIFSHRKI